MQKFSISYLVPAYNERENLSSTIAEIEKLAVVVENYEIVIVDDGSTDGTCDVIRQFAKHNGHIVPVYHEKNKGFGAAYRSAFQNASKTHCMLIPGDNAHPAYTLKPILQELGNADLIVPFVSNKHARPAIRQLISHAFVVLLNTTMRMSLPYYNGLVLHRTDLLKLVNPQTSGFAYQAEILVKLVKAGASYKTVATEIGERAHGTTNAFKTRNVIQVLVTVIHLWNYVYYSKNKTKLKVTKLK